jgi:hypothetical protein
MQDRPDKNSAKLESLLEGWRLRFIREGFQFDDITEISIYPVVLTPFRRHYSRKRDQREFNVYPIVYWREIEPVAIDDFSHACYMHYALQEKNIMRNTFEEYGIVIFPVIVSPNVDSIALSHIQRHHAEHGDDTEFPVIYDLDLDMVYMRRTNPGKGDPFFDPYRGEIEYILKG